MKHLTHLSEQVNVCACVCSCIGVCTVVRQCIMPHPPMSTQDLYSVCVCVCVDPPVSMQGLYSVCVCVCVHQPVSMQDLYSVFALSVAFVS